MTRSRTHMKIALHGRRGAKRGLLSLAAATAALTCGCVERVMRISTDPQGARVFVNDEDVGLTPARFTFLWYGDYDLVIRKPGFKTVRTHHRVEPPWHQYPPFDLIGETMVATTIRDEHDVPLIKLEPETTPPASELVERAVGMRDETLYGGTTVTTSGAAPVGSAPQPGDSPSASDGASTSPSGSPDSAAESNDARTSNPSGASPGVQSPAGSTSPAGKPGATPPPLATDSSSSAGLQIRTITEGASPASAPNQDVQPPTRP